MGRIIKGGVTYEQAEQRVPKSGSSICKKMFMSKKTLEAHERGHQGERPLPCSICSASFTSYHGHDQHM